MPHYLLVTIFAVLMLPGFLGVFLPLIPSVPFMFAIALIFEIFDRFKHLHWPELLILGILALLSFATDHLSGLVGAKYGGASGKAVLVGLLGFILGGVVLPPFGGIIGLFLAILIYELLVSKDQQKAVKAATGSLLGTVGGMIVNLLLAIIFVILFIVFAR